MRKERWIGMAVELMIAMLFAGEASSGWGQNPTLDTRILDRAAELHAKNPTFRVTLQKAGPFEFGERIFVDSNFEEINKRLYPPSHASDPYEVRVKRENELRFATVGALVEGPASCGDFSVPCQYNSYQRSRVLQGGHTARLGEGLHPINAGLPPLSPGRYRFAMLVGLIDQATREAVVESRLKGEAVPLPNREEEYLVSNVLEFEVLPLNQEWVDARLAALSAMPPPHGWKPESRVAGGSRPWLAPSMPLGEMLFLPTEAALATAYEYYVKTEFDPVLATFYFHPDLTLACKFLMAQISEQSYPLLPKILEQTSHVCVDSEHHFQQYHDAGARYGKAAYYAALQLRFDDYDRFRLQLARLTAARLREEPENEVALRAFLDATGALYDRTLASKQLNGEFAELRRILEPSLRNYSLPMQQILLRRRDLIPDEMAIKMALKVLDERWPESVCTDGKLRVETEFNQWIYLRRAAFARILKADAEKAKALVEAMVERLDPTLDWSLAESLPFAVAVPPTLVEEARGLKPKEKSCGRRTDSRVLQQIQMQAMPLDSLEGLVRDNADYDRARGSEVLLRRDAKRYAELTLELVRKGDNDAADFASALLGKHQARQQVPPALLEELGLALLALPDVESAAQGARALRHCGKDYKQLLTERYKKIDRALLATGVSEQNLGRAEGEFRNAISRGVGWLTTKEEIIELDRYCDFDACREGLHHDVHYLLPVVILSFSRADENRTQTQIGFGQYHDYDSVLYDNEDTLNLIKRYPRDTPIRIRRWTTRGRQSPLDVEMTWVSKLKAEGFTDVDID